MPDSSLWPSYNEVPRSERSSRVSKHLSCFTFSAANEILWSRRRDAHPHRLWRVNACNDISIDFSGLHMY